MQKWSFFFSILVLGSFISLTLGVRGFALPEKAAGELRDDCHIKVDGSAMPLPASLDRKHLAGFKEAKASYTFAPPNLRPSGRRFIRRRSASISADFGLQTKEIDSPGDYIEVDLSNNQIRLADFCLGNYKIDGDFLFELSREGGLSMLNLEGKNISFNGRNIPWVKIKLAKIKDIIFINHLALPQYAAKGRIDLGENQLTLDLNGSWEEKSKVLEGQMEVKVKVWGDIGNLFTSGCLMVKGGKYKGNDFNELRLDFLGKPPVFNITDSEIILKGGSVLGIEGMLDLRDFSNLIPNAEFIVQKIFFDEWQMFSEDKKNVGLKKNIDDKFDILLNANEQQDASAEAGTEVRYSWKKDKYFKLKMHDDEAIFGFEQKRDF